MRSSRTSFVLYHPDKNPGATFAELKQEFYKQIKTAKQIADLYLSEMTNHESIYNKQVMQDIDKIVKEAEKDQDIYTLEALAELVLAGEKHFKVFPYFRELKEVGERLKARDAGLVLPGDTHMPKKPIRLVK